MKTRCLVVVLSCGLTCGLAHAEGTSQITDKSCATTFGARLKDARGAIREQFVYMTEYKRAMPWFYEHCRMLTPLEIAVRRINDPRAFVCDTTKGRPKGLTPRFVSAHGAEADVPIFQERAMDDLQCAKHDPISLDMHGIPAADDATKKEKVSVLGRMIDVQCYGEVSAKCAKARKGLVEVRALLDASPAKKVEGLKE